MSKQRYSAVKGVEDIIPPASSLWQSVEQTARDTFGLYGFSELRPPVIEHTEVFARSIGESSDIVEKEMYTFEDKAGRSITLRPEGTASVVRGFVEHSLNVLPHPQKFYYMGPMFRYERPQKGRQRQFYQIGAEVFGSPGPLIDAEVVSMLVRFLGNIGLGGLSLEINSIGCPECRPAYRAALVGFLSQRIHNFCPDCERRLLTNPLRILDCKVPKCIEERKGAPAVSEHLCETCNTHFSGLKALLSGLNIPYRHNPEMVRGLDYYTRTAFEVTTTRLGAQNAVAAGGRYDSLVSDFGGPDTPAIGFAMGMERIIALLSEGGLPEMKGPKVYIAALGREASEIALKLAEDIRSHGISAVTGGDGASLKSQMRRADKSGAEYVYILGEDEIKSGKIKWKNLREAASGEIPIADALDFIEQP